MSCQRDDIKIGTILTKGRTAVKIIGSRGLTTILVVPEPKPISSRLETRAIRVPTLLRDWTVRPLFTEFQKAEARRIGELVELGGFLHRVYKTHTGQIVAIPAVLL